MCSLTGLERLSVAFFDLFLSLMVVMVFYGFLWSLMTEYWFDWTCIVFSWVHRLKHSFGLIQRWLKILRVQNHLNFLHFSWPFRWPREASVYIGPRHFHRLCYRHLDQFCRDSLRRSRRLTSHGQGSPAEVEPIQQICSRWRSVMSLKIYWKVAWLHFRQFDSFSRNLSRG